MNFSFQHPYLLSLSLLLIPVCWLIWRGYTERERLLHKFTGYRKNLTLKKLFISFLSATLLGSLLIIAAGPRKELGSQYAGQTADFVFLVDVSRSMAARNDCNALTRLARVRSIMQDIVRSFPGARFGLMAFSKLSFVLAEPNYDQEYLLEIIANGIIIETVPFPGSDVSNALQVFLEKKNDEPRVFEEINNIILFSDGDFSVDDIQDLGLAVSQINTAGVAITVIGIGSEDGVPIPTLDANRQCLEGQFERADGKEFYTHLVEDQLRFLARETGGDYFHESALDDLPASLLRRFAPAEDIVQEEFSEDVSILFMLLATFSLIILIVIRYM